MKNILFVISTILMLSSLYAGETSVKLRVVDKQCTDTNKQVELQWAVLLKEEALHGEGNVEIVFRLENLKNKITSKEERQNLELLSATKSAFSIAHKTILNSADGYTHLSFYFLITPSRSQSYVDRGEHIDRSYLRFLGEKRYLEDPEGKEILKAYKNAQDSKAKEGFEYGHYRVKLTKPVCYKTASKATFVDLARVVP